MDREETAIARQRLGIYTPMATDGHAKMEELLEVLFHVRSAPRLYNKGQSDNEEFIGP